MTQDRDELLRLLAEATAGPWRWDRTTINAHIHQVDGLHWLASCVIGQGDWHSPDASQGVRNAKLIVAAVNALSPLLAQQQAYELRIAALEAGLRPFAAIKEPPTAFTDCSDVERTHWFKAGDLRTARALLADAPRG